MGLVGCTKHDELALTQTRPPIVTAAPRATASDTPNITSSVTPTTTPTGAPFDTAAPTATGAQRAAYTITICASTFGPERPCPTCDMGTVHVFPTMRLDPPAGFPPRLEIDGLLAVIEDVPPGRYPPHVSGCAP